MRCWLNGSSQNVDIWGMGREFQVEGVIQSINIYQEPALSQGLVVGAGDTQMALASEEVTDKGDRCVDSHQCCDQKERVHRVRGVGWAETSKAS